MAETNLGDSGEKPRLKLGKWLNFRGRTQRVMKESILENISNNEAGRKESLRRESRGTGSRGKGRSRLSLLNLTSHVP